MLIKQKTLFSKEECDIILNLYNDIPQKWNFSDRNFISNAIKYSSQTSWLFDKLKTFFETETNIQIRTIKKQIHFHTFKEGDWFGKHNDTRDRRVYGVGVLLNENFEGGDFKLYNQHVIVLDKVIGNTYIFDVRIEHEILPILGGERYSLLWFLQNEHIKIKINKLI
jgi:hypothetical protein